MDGKYASIAEYAEQYGLSAATIRRHIAAGDIPAVRAGRQIRIPVTDADAAFLKPVGLAR